RFDNQRIAWTLDAETDQLEKSRIENPALVNNTIAAVNFHFGAVVWIVVRGDSQVIPGRVSGLCYGPFLDVPSPLVCCFEILCGACLVAVECCDFSSADKPGNLGCYCRRRIAGLFLPAVLIRA